jgi:hypothetical protein
MVACPLYLFGNSTHDNTVMPSAAAQSLADSSSTRLLVSEARKDSMTHMSIGYHQCVGHTHQGKLPCLAHQTIAKQQAPQC